MDDTGLYNHHMDCNKKASWEALKGAAATCDAPLQVTPLPDVVEQEHYAHFLYNASSRAAPASPLPKQAPAAAGGAQDSSAAGSSATAAESEDTATAHEPNLAATAASSPAPATAGYGSMQAGEKGFEARPGETVETLRELLARRRAELSTKSALEVRAEGGSFGAASNAATAGSSEDGATMATAGSSTTVEQPVRANGHAAAAAEEAVAAAAQQVHAEGDANGVNGASDAELGAEQPPPPPPGDPEPAAQPSAASCCQCPMPLLADTLPLDGVRVVD